MTSVSGVGSALSAQTATIAGVIAGVTVGATRAIKGNIVVNGVTTSTIGPLIMARSTAARLMLGSIATTRGVMADGVTPGELIVHATGATGVNICWTHTRTLCYPHW